MDQWHGMLLGAISSLTAAVVALWRENRRLHADHKDDIKDLTQAGLQLGLSVVARARPRRGSATLPPPSTEVKPSVDGKPPVDTDAT